MSDRIYIIFCSDTGAILSRASYEKGDLIVIPDAPEKEGYCFTGWSPAINMQAQVSMIYTAE